MIYILCPLLILYDGLVWYTHHYQSHRLFLVLTSNTKLNRNPSNILGDETSCHKDKYDFPTLRSSFEFGKSAT
jgi:hypothetical protein